MLTAWPDKTGTVRELRADLFTLYIIATATAVLEVAAEIFLTAEWQDQRAAEEYQAGFRLACHLATPAWCSIQVLAIRC